MKPQRVEPDVTIRFAQGRRTYAPGEGVAAEIRVANWRAIDCRRAEASVVWHTAGKGDEDLHVHELRALPVSGADAVDLSSPYRLEATLPECPLSYDGVIVKVCWCVRLRLLLPGYRSVAFEAPFRLGEAWSPSPPAEEEHAPA